MGEGDATPTLATARSNATPQAAEVQAEVVLAKVQGLGHQWPQRSRQGHLRGHVSSRT